MVVARMKKVLRKKVESVGRSGGWEGGKVKKCEEVLAAQGEYPRYKEYCRLCTFFKTSFSRFVGNLTPPSPLESLVLFFSVRPLPRLPFSPPIPRCPPRLPPHTLSHRVGRAIYLCGSEIVNGRLFLSRLSPSYDYCEFCTGVNISRQKMLR